MTRPLITRRRIDAIKAFSEIEVDLKKMLQHLRHETNKHEPAYFAAVHNLSDKQLTNFSGMYPFLLFSWNLLGLAKTFASPSISQAAICVAPTLRLKDTHTQLKPFGRSA
jgi:hypothetical protein